MTKSEKFSKFAALAVTALLLSACGGGSGDTNSTASEELIAAPEQEVEAWEWNMPWIF